MADRYVSPHWTLSQRVLGRPPRLMNSEITFSRGIGYTGRSSHIGTPSHDSSLTKMKFLWCPGEDSNLHGLAATGT